MKKNLFIAVLLIFILTASVLTACSVTTCKDGHTWVNGEVTKEATCDTYGEMMQKCSVCSATQPIAVNPIGHKYGNWSADADGLTHSRVCENDPSHIDKANHADADANYVCDACGFEIEVPVCDHTWGAWTDNGDGTCSRICTLDSTHTETGDHIDANTDEICDNCGRNDHICQWGEFTYNEDGTHTRVCALNDEHSETFDCSGGTATCEEDGVCSVCGGAYIPATDHNYPSTWTDNGENHKKVCGNGCGKDLTSEHNHEETGRTTADCDNAEKITMTCSDCGNSYTEDGEPSIGHNIVKQYAVELGKLFWTEVCTNDCECSHDDIKEEITAMADVATAEDLRTVLENGFSARLTADIELKDGPIEINAGNVTLDLNGHNLTSTGVKLSPTSGYMVCDVFIVRGELTYLTIQGEGTVLANPSEEAIAGIDPNKLSVCVLSALYGATVEIKGGTYHSTGCTTIFARTFIDETCKDEGGITPSAVYIWDGKFIADDPEYTIDILETEIITGYYARINVYGGEFVKFNPDNHSNDGGYKSKVVSAYSHVRYNEEAQTYIVENHNYVYAESSVLGNCEMLKYCEDCGLHIDFKPQLEDGDVLVGFSEVDGKLSKEFELTLEAVDGEENTFYVRFNHANKYLTRIDGESFTAEKVEEGKWLAKAEMVQITNDDGKSDFVVRIYFGIPGEGYDEFPSDFVRYATCQNHQPRIELEGFEDCTLEKTATLICDNCGLNRLIQRAEGGEHIPSKEVSRTPATCTTPEIIEYQCMKCDNTYTEEGEGALGHAWTYEYCGDGSHNMVCTNDNKHTDNVMCNPKGEFITQVPATCTSGAYTRYECDLCGGVTTSTPGEPLGHDYVWVNNGDGTCTGTCTRDCEEGHTISQDHVDEDGNCCCDNCEADLHNYEVAEQVEPTHQMSGYIKYICTKCDESYTDELEQVIECIVYWRDLGNGTCQSACEIENCNFPYDGPFEHIDEDGDCLCDRGCGAEVHNITRTVDKIEPTCMEEGYTIYACANCNEVTETRDFVGKADHDMTLWKDCGNGYCELSCRFGCTNFPTDDIGLHIDVEGNDGICDRCQTKFMEDTQVMIDFSTDADRILQSTATQVWMANSAKLTNNKASSTSNVVADVKPVKFYKSSEVIIECVGMSKIVFDCSGVESKYVEALTKSLASIDGTVVNVNGIITLTLNNVVDEISFVNTEGQARCNSITITAKRCVGDHIGDATDEICDLCGAEWLHQHKYESTTTAPTCTTAGYTTFLCSCGKSYTEDGDPATGHATSFEDVDGRCVETCSNCEYRKESAHTDERDGDGICDNCEKALSEGDTQKEEITTTLTFDDKAKRTEFTSDIQVWEENGIVLTNNRASSSNPVADYAKPARFYSGSTLIVECAGMKKIVFDCNSSSYATALKNSIGTPEGVTVTVSSDKVTVEFAPEVDSFTINLTGQVRMDALTVTAMQ